MMTTPGILASINYRGEINLEGQQLGDQGCRELVKQVKESVKENGGQCLVTSINLKRNDIGDEGASYLVELIQFSMILHLSYNKLTNYGDDLLFEAINERRKQNLPSADFYSGYNPGIKRWWFQRILVHGPVSVPVGHDSNNNKQE